jgi:uncharacterized protein YlaI
MVTTEQVTDQYVYAGLQPGIDSPPVEVFQLETAPTSLDLTGGDATLVEDDEPPVHTFLCDGCLKRFLPTEIRRYRNPRMLICNACKPRIAAIINELAPFDFDDDASYRKITRAELFEDQQERREF